MIKIVAMLVVLAGLTVGCGNSQRGRFVASEARGYAFSSPGGIDIVLGAPTTPIIGSIIGSTTEPDRNLLYIIFISSKPPHRTASGTDFGQDIMTISQTLNDGTNDVAISFKWNRQKDTVLVGKQEFSREKGNVYVVRLNMKGEVFCQQLASLGPHSSAQEVIDHARQQLPADAEIGKLTLKKR